MLGIIGMLIAIALLIFLAMRGYNILLIALICSIVAALAGGLNIYEALMDNYMTGYVGFFKSYFPMFLVGALFGKLMEESNAADAIAALIVRKLGASKAVLAVVLSCFILAYGGVSVFVVGFTIYPIAVNLFREANLPRKFLPGTLAFGSVTFAMTSPGTPQIQNMIPTNTLGTNAMSGAVIGVIAGVFMLVVGMIWLTGQIKKDVAKGGKYEAYAGEMIAVKSDDELPNPIVSLVPPIMTILLLNLFKLPVEISIVVSILIGAVLLNKHLKNYTAMFTTGSAGAISAITNTCAVVGFGGVIKAIPAFQVFIDAVTHMPGPPLVGAAVAVTAVCGITGSASGGLGISIPIVGPIYVAMGVAPAALHRVAAIASGALDSLPHNGYIVTTLNICKSNHKEGYYPMFMLTVILPAIACAIAIVLFQLFPNWP